MTQNRRPGIVNVNTLMMLIQSLPKPYQPFLREKVGACSLSVHMVRDWKELGSGGGGTGLSGGSASVFVMLWAALATFVVISAIIFSCADGVPKDKASTNGHDTYGSTCAAAGCGAGCGA
ncbi:hypothetical protein ACFX13_021015 [Malus domestica]